MKKIVIPRGAFLTALLLVGLGVLTALATLIVVINKPRPTTPAVTISTSRLHVKEWGVSLPQNYVGDLYYTYASEHPNTISFHSATLDSVCRGESVVVSRGHADDLVYSSSGVPTGTFAQQSDLRKGRATGWAWQVDDYIYLYPVAGPSACAVEATRDTEQAAVQDIVSRILLMQKD